MLIAVEACGVCGADAADIDRADPTLKPPRVPVHEVVGRIVALGEGVPSLWRLNQRVGVGRLGGHCNVCVQCRQGHFQLCRNQPYVGASCDGGYAEMMVARATGLVSIPDELKWCGGERCTGARVLLRSHASRQPHRPHAAPIAAPPAREPRCRTSSR